MLGFPLVGLRSKTSLGLWNQSIRFVIKDQLIWSELHKSIIDELLFGKQMFGNPFPDPKGESEPYLVMMTKNGIVRFFFDYPLKRLDDSDEYLIAEFPLRLFSELPESIMNFHGKDARKSRAEYMKLRRYYGYKPKSATALLQKYQFARPERKFRREYYQDWDGDECISDPDEGFRTLFENPYFLIKFKTWR
jgi:hypothetical protein